MKLDKLERHTAYIILLAELEEAESNLESIWLWHLFEDATGIYPTSELLPEFFKFRPEKPLRSGGWWDGYDYNKRVSALKQCIEETR